MKQTHNNFNHHPSRAFTLIELLVVIAIIGLLSSIILVSLSNAKERAKDAVRMSDLNTMKTALELYANDHKGTYPSTISTGDTPDIYGLNTCSSWQQGTLTGRTDWIPEIVADSYIPTLPHDPDGLATYTGNTTDGCTNTYIYASDGTNYTLSTGIRTFSTNPAFASSTNFNNGGGDNGGNNNGGNNNTSACTTSNCGLQFDGSQNYVSIPASPVLLPAQFTIEAWVYPTVVSGLNMVWDDDNTQDGYYMDIQDGLINVGMDGVGGFNGVTTVTTNTWHHIAATYDGTNLKIWLDGNLESTNSSTLPNDPGTPAYIGWYTTGTDVFNGIIDEVRLSNIARYTSNFTPATSLTSDGSTVALWKFDQSSGTTVADISGNGHRGTLEGSPTPSLVNGVGSGGSNQNDNGSNTATSTASTTITCTSDTDNTMTSPAASYLTQGRVYMADGSYVEDYCDTNLDASSTVLVEFACNAGTPALQLIKCSNTANSCSLGRCQ